MIPMIFLIETDSQLEIRDLKTLTLEKFVFIFSVYIFEHNFYNKKILTFIFSLYNFKLTKGDK